MAARHPTRPGTERTPTPVVEEVERETTQPYERTTTILDLVELAVRRRCETCQKDGGAMHALAEEVQGVAARVEAAVKVLDERRGEKRVWGILRAVAVPVLIAAATGIITWQGSERAKEQTARAAERAAEVVRELKSFRDSQVMPPDYDMATKARP